MFCNFLIILWANASKYGSLRYGKVLYILYAPLLLAPLWKLPGRCRIPSSHPLLPRPFILLSCPIIPACFSYLYHLFFLPEPVPDAHGIRHFVSAGLFILHTGRLIIKILFLCRVQFLIKCLHRVKCRGLREGFTPSPEISSWHSLNHSKAVRRADASQTSKTACLKPDISVSKQTATITPLFAAFRLLFVLVLQALMPAPNHAAFNGCPLPLFCSLSATLCPCVLKIWLYLGTVEKLSLKV